MTNNKEDSGSENYDENEDEVTDLILKHKKVIKSGLLVLKKWRFNSKRCG